MKKKSTFAKDGKLFGKISIIDIIVVLCVIVLAFGIYAKFTSNSDAVSSSEKAKIEYVYKVKEESGILRLTRLKKADLYMTRTQRNIWER